MARQGPEIRIVERIVKQLRALPQCHARKVHGGMYGQAGEPDVDACIAGRCLKIEVKVPGKENSVTPLQVAAINRWREAGALAFVATSWDEVEERLKAECLI